MSANLDLVRSIFADLERGDFSFPLSSPEWADPQIEWVVADGPEAGSRTGQAVWPWVEGFTNVWEGLRSEANEYRELDDRRVLVLYRQKGRGKGSGVEVDQRRVSCFHLGEGKVTRVVTYWDPDRALADLGLAAEDEEP